MGRTKLAIKESSITKTIADLAVDALIENGIKTLYCLPGVQNDVFFDALFHRTSEIEVVHARHEQGAAYMATGAALATGKPQAFCVVPGPGFLNTTAALSTAYAVNAPVLALIGQIPSGAVGKGHGLLHEIPNQFEILQGLCKTAYQVQDSANAAQSFKSAFSDLNSGRPRPVGVEVPVDMWPKEVSGTDTKATRKPLPPPDGNLMKQAAALIDQAQAPMIVVGGGALDHPEHVRALARITSAPVLAYRNGRGVMPSNDPLSLSMPAGHDLWPKVDVVIGLGARLQSQVMLWGSDDDLKIVHIDIDDAQLNKSASADVAVHTDLADALPVLMESLSQAQPDRSPWLAQVSAAKQGRENQFLEKLGPQMAWLGAIRDALPRNGIFVDELTQNGYVSRFAFPVYEPRTFISSGYQGTLGYGFATALGAAHARRDVPVVSITGDGGALFTISELATAVRHNIPLTMIVFTDNAFGNVKRIQTDQYGGRHIACDLTSPDFVTLAQSFGVNGQRATSPEELSTALKSAFKHSGPNVIEVPVADMPSPWEFVLMPRNRGF